MNFEWIKKCVKIGSRVELNCADGKYVGEVLDISDDCILMQDDEQNVIGLSGSQIVKFKIIVKDGNVPFDKKNPSTDNGKSELAKSEYSATDSVQSESNTAISKFSSEEKPETKIYREGDIIPMEILYQRDPSLRKRLSASGNGGMRDKMNAKPKSIGKGMAALEAIAGERHKEEIKRKLAPKGEIISINLGKNLGYIRDPKIGYELYFSLDQIVDDRLRDDLKVGTSVLYTMSSNDIGNAAATVRLPDTIENSLKLAKKQNSWHAKNIVNQILEQYPGDFAASAFKFEMKRNPGVPVPFTSKSGTGASVYARATEFRLTKNYEAAIPLYLEAIKNNEKLESSVKDLGFIYASLFKSSLDILEKENYREKTLRLIEKYKSAFRDVVVSWNYLENLFYSVNEFEKYITITDKLLNSQEIRRDVDRRKLIYTKRSVAFAKLKRIDEAKKSIEMALDLKPDDSYALKVQSALDDFAAGKIKEEIFLSLYLDSSDGTLSKYIQHTLDNYTEYRGLLNKAVQLDTVKFSIADLNKIKDVLAEKDEKKLLRADEKADLLLTEAKLMQELDPENRFEFLSVLAKYCNAVATNGLMQKKKLESIQFFYIESFMLAPNYDFMSRQIPFYLLSFIYDHQKLNDELGKPYAVETIATRLINANAEQHLWNGVVTMFVASSVISGKLVPEFYNSILIRSSAIEYFKHNGITLENNCTLEDFAKIWNEIIQKNIVEQLKLDASISSILKSCNYVEKISESIKQLIDSLEGKKNILDETRLRILTESLSSSVESYVKSTGYRNKENNYHSSNECIEKLIGEIDCNPTRVSFDYIRPFLIHIKKVLELSFEDIVAASEPKIKIVMVSEETVVNSDGTVSIQISVENDRDSSPIRDVSLSIDNTSDVQLVQGDKTAYNAIDGGEHKIFRLTIKVGERALKDKASVISTKCVYNTQGEKKETSIQLSLRLYEPCDFSLIENPYAAVADSGPVRVGSKMFFGRDSFIEGKAKALMESSSKQIIIYGQKRCGKTSVLLHLKHKLMETGKTFCVMFSLEAISQDLSEISFYHKILEEISESLEYSKGISPDFKIPSKDEFAAEDKSVPLNTFTKYMARFKRACEQIPEWKDKQLIVLIDEFTYIYSGIKRGVVSDSIMRQWKAIMQDERSQFSVVLVGHDAFPSFKKEPYASNAFGITEDFRLTYLDEKSARELIEKPILDSNGRSRYVGDAVTKILDYTSTNPYYIQMFCSRLVDSMNNNKAINVTEVDVDDVAMSMVEGATALTDDKFDNLLHIGDAGISIDGIDEECVNSVLREVAKRSKNSEYCSRNDINVLDDKEKENEILKQLCDREVLGLKGEKNYKILVRLFKLWLLNH